MSVHDTHAGDLRPLIHRFFRSPFEREEAAQEIWLHVHRMTAAYDPSRGALLPWLRALAANRCREILRARGRRPDPSLPIEEGLLVTSETPEDAARHDRLRVAMTAFGETLREDERAVFRLSLMEDLTHDEVAARLGISPRRAKYLKLKLMACAAAVPALRAALDDLLEP